MSATQIRKFYETKGDIIFPKMNLGFWAGELLERLKKGNFSQSLHESQGLESVLRLPDVFPDDLLFGALAKEALVVSYDTYNRKAIVFKPTGRKSAKVPVWQVCGASTAAPAAYPGCLLKELQFLAAHKSGDKVEGDLERIIQEDVLPLIDGGCWRIIQPVVPSPNNSTDIQRQLRRSKRMPLSRICLSLHSAQDCSDVPEVSSHSAAAARLGSNHHRAMRIVTPSGFSANTRL